MSHGKKKCCFKNTGTDVSIYERIEEKEQERKVTVAILLIT